MRNNTLSLVTLFFCACTQDNALNERDDFVSPNDWPAIVVEPSRLDFGALRYDESAELTFTMYNDGTDHSELIIDEIALPTGDKQGFVLKSPLDEPIKLRFGEHHTMTVQFTPPLPDVMIGEVLVKSNDDLHASVPVSLQGFGTMPRLELSPSTYQYDDTIVGCERQTEFTLTNTGNEEVVVTEIESTGPAFVLHERPLLPLTLAPKASANLTANFVPTHDGAVAGALTATSNDPRGEQRADSTGIGLVPGNYLDSFTIPARGAIDLMFVVDQSFSMEDEQAMLAANAVAFAEWLSTATDDWQVMVVSAEDGCHSGEIMTPTTVDFPTVFANAVQAGAENGYSEALIYLGALAADQSDVEGCNEGFVRPEALLHTIYISDEYEGSYELTGIPWQTYLEGLQATKGAEYLVKMSAIAGDVPSGCDSGANHAGPGVGYDAIAQKTHGGFLSICSDWSMALNTVAAYGVSRSTYPLSHTPDRSTIEVRVNGVLRTEEDWHYMSDRNSVVFTMNIPHSGDVIDINSSVPYTCQ